MLDDLAVGMVYMGFLAFFFLLAGALCWLTENVRWANRLMCWFLDKTSLSVSEEPYELWYFTCMKPHLEVLEAGKWATNGTIEIYSDLQTALSMMHPADSCVVELAIPVDMLSNIDLDTTVAGLRWDDEAPELINDVMTMKEALKEVKRV